MLPFLFVWITLSCFGEQSLGQPDVEGDIIPTEEGQFYVYDVKDPSGKTLSLKVTPKPNNHSFIFSSGGPFTTLQRSNPCRMTGKVIGVAQSYVSLDTCGDLSGFVILHEQEYRVENQHITLVENTAHPFKDIKCGVENHHNLELFHNINEEGQLQHSNIESTLLMIELFVVVDDELLSLPGIDRDENKAIQFVEDIIFLTDELYKRYEVRVFLMGLEILNNTETYPSSSSADELLTWVAEVKQPEVRETTRISIDAFMLISGKTFDDGTAGLAYVDTYCRDTFVSVLSVYTGDLNPMVPAIVAVHEIGHNLGMEHYQNYGTNACTCGDDTGFCFMTGEGINPSLSVTTFSSCSLTTLADTRVNARAECMLNEPDVVFGGPVCGNGIKETGEVCDCGSAQECQSDNCCTELCQFKSGAVCSNEVCCNNCQFANTVTVCRQASECDIVEKCDGKSAECPVDVYVQDYSPCEIDSESGTCNEKICITRLGNCQRLWGEEETYAAPGFCFNRNVNGISTGNCGVESDLSFIPCTNGNKTCGLNWCETTSTSANINVGHSLITVTYTLGDARVECKAASTNTQENPGLVDDGSPCSGAGYEGVCINQNCVSIENLPIQRCPSAVNGTVCSGHGVCNNLAECSCDEGYYGYDCSVYIQTALRRQTQCVATY